jgi:hypothetical protein
MSTERPTYETLRETAIECVQSMSPTLDADGHISLDTYRIRAIRAPSCMHTWGPHYFALSRYPTPRDTESFISHMQRLIATLETWSVVVKDVIVDQERRIVMLQTHMPMTPKGLGSKKDRTVMTEVLWYITMVEDGLLVESVKEYIDAEASIALFQKMKAGRESGVV